MLSGNGRHRRPRQAPALVVAAGVTGSAIAIPLLGASGAGAADGTTWDRVAECETGGAWSQNSGNGYYGGLQLSQEHWETYGGLDYASSADTASRSQQIEIAEKVLAAEGIAAWPTCGLLAGLENDSSTGAGGGTASDGPSDGTPAGSPTADASGTPGTAPGADKTPDPGAEGAGPGTSDPAAEPSSPSADPAAGADESAESDTSPVSPVSPESSAPTDPATTKRDDSDNSGQSEGASDPGATDRPGAGRHRGDSADEGADTAAGDGRTGESSGRHASRDGAAAREAADGTYTVRSGDSLWLIADSLELGGGWSALYAANEDVVGADPDHILPGQTLAVGGETGEK
ncbi:transglycosylase family protein [Streptomyces poriticola]|uniref:transglycosylase family protein n=1 Tax=Streptomyces poriticola TaxID=3120506 RepID=UPI002FCE4BBF